MMKNLSGREKPIYIVCIIIVLILSCSPRTTRLGLPQHEYTYQIPQKVDDEWEHSSLKAEGVDSKKIKLKRQSDTRRRRLRCASDTTNLQSSIVNLQFRFIRVG